jgi:signal transduction histidine kinase
MERILSLLSEDKELTNIFDEADTAKRILESWASVQKFFPERGWLYYGDLTNRLIVSPPWTPDKDYTCLNRPWFTTAAAATGIVWPKPYIDYATNEYVLTASKAVFDDEGELRGVLAIDTFISKLLSLIELQAESQSVPILIVTYDGTIVGDNGIYYQKSALTSSGKWTNLIQNKKSGFFKTDNKDEYFSASIDIPSLRVLMLSLLPAEIITAQIKHVILTIIITFGIGLIVAVFLALLLSHSLVENIEQLTGYIQKLEEGSAELNVCVKSQDELYRLNLGINRMVTRLKARTEMINSLFYLISHNISNNIMVILLKSKTLLEPEEYLNNEDSVLHNIRTINEISQSIQKLITNLVISRNVEEQGQGLLFVRAVSPMEILSTVLNRQERNALKKQQQIEVKINHKDTDIHTDANLLVEVLDNLVNNAIKFAPLKGRIKIELIQKPDQISFVVSDNGPGIPEDEEKLLFVRFANLSAKPTGGEVSNHIGLSVSKEIIEILGGRILLHRQQGWGCIFEINLPRTVSRKFKDFPIG